MCEMGTELVLLSIDKINFLRGAMGRAIDELAIYNTRQAWDILQAALDETDPGTMKVWQPGEEPF